MNKIIQLIIGLIFVALSIGILVYIYLKVLPTKQVRESVSKVKIIENTNIIDSGLVEIIKQQRKPEGIPVTVGEGEVSKDNPFSRY